MYEYVHFFLHMFRFEYDRMRVYVVSDAEAVRSESRPDGSLFTNKKSSQFEANRGFTRGWKIHGELSSGSVRRAS